MKIEISPGFGNWGLYGHSKDETCMCTLGVDANPWFLLDCRSHVATRQGVRAAGSGAWGSARLPSLP